MIPLTNLPGIEKLPGPSDIWTLNDWQISAFRKEKIGFMSQVSSPILILNVVENVNGANHVHFLKEAMRHLRPGRKSSNRRKRIRQLTASKSSLTWARASFRRCLTTTSPPQSPISSTCRRLVFMLINYRLINKIYIQGTFFPFVCAHVGRTQSFPAERNK